MSEFEYSESPQAVGKSGLRGKQRRALVWQKFASICEGPRAVEVEQKRVKF